MTIEQDIKKTIDILKKKEPKQIFKIYIDRMYDIMHDDTMNEKQKSSEMETTIMNICFVDIAHNYPNALIREQASPDISKE